MRLSLFLLSLLGLAGVALGAFGAHALAVTLADRSMTDVWRTAVMYHLLHTIAGVAVALSPLHGRLAGRVVVWSWIIGVVLFSGSLYWLALGGPTVLGPVTPLGGAGFLVGWAALAWCAATPEIKPQE